MMYTIYLLVAIATIEDRVMQKEVLLSTKYPSICILNLRYAEQSIKPPEGVKFNFKCVQQQRTDA